MLNKVIVLGVVAISLTGCIVAPFDDGHRGSHGRYDQRHDSNHRWDQRRDGDRHRYDRDRNDRDWNWKGR
ncbi:hypothetical protein [Acinetobacter guillouiae]|uniref:hypothetical protein n=1 Tax=Acinetobacter guillouiae TaxID=106649 RepID=UPI003341EF7C